MSASDNKTNLQRKLGEVLLKEIDLSDETLLRKVMDAVVSKVTDCRKATKLAKNLLSVEQDRVGSLVSTLFAKSQTVKSLMNDRTKYDDELRDLRARQVIWKRTLHDEIVAGSTPPNSSSSSSNNDNDSNKSIKIKSNVVVPETLEDSESPDWNPAYDATSSTEI